MHTPVEDNCKQKKNQMGKTILSKTSVRCSLFNNHEVLTRRSGRRPHRSTVNMTTIDCGTFKRINCIE